MKDDYTKGPETKPRSDRVSHPDCDYDVHACDAGGKYQELPTLGGFTEVVEGSRTQRLHGRCYKKTELAKKEDPLDSLIRPDTHGPPFENTSVPKRIL
jgi:hypothetical protein